ncbi:uncharacterized protein LOC131933442 [Physella acuta]|uniref:uncharacterized protein LOC131933442 n=1 Tax=Physella acuta TaxID=109671 RepID=UPI0027DC345C|nr:uncharacterized protein LOC131933442 [Physella acuta]
MNNFRKTRIYLDKNAPGSNTRKVFDDTDSSEGETEYSENNEFLPYKKAELKAAAEVLKKENFVVFFNRTKRTINEDDANSPHNWGEESDSSPFPMPPIVFLNKLPQASDASSTTKETVDDSGGNIGSEIIAVEEDLVFNIKSTKANCNTHLKERKCKKRKKRNSDPPTCVENSFQPNDILEVPANKIKKHSCIAASGDVTQDCDSTIKVAREVNPGREPNLTDSDDYSFELSDIKDQNLCESASVSFYLNKLTSFKSQLLCLNEEFCLYQNTCEKENLQHRCTSLRLLISRMVTLNSEYQHIRVAENIRSLKWKFSESKKALFKSHAEPISSGFQEFQGKLSTFFSKVKKSVKKHNALLISGDIEYFVCFKNFKLRRTNPNSKKKKVTEPVEEIFLQLKPALIQLLSPASKSIPENRGKKIILEILNSWKMEIENLNKEVVVARAYLDINQKNIGCEQAIACSYLNTLSSKIVDFNLKYEKFRLAHKPYGKPKYRLWSFCDSTRKVLGADLKCVKSGFSCIRNALDKIVLYFRDAVVDHKEALGRKINFPHGVILVNNKAESKISRHFL